MMQKLTALGLAAVLSMTPAIAATPVCTTGELFAGAPVYGDPSQRAKDGQGLLDVPPLAMRSIVFAGDKLVTSVGPEIWFSDIAAPSPTLQRLAGREVETGRSSKAGKCLEARFGSISGIATLPDGRIAGADQMANLVFVVSDPFGPACTVTFIAGATEGQASLNPGHPEHEGDRDGPGDKAEFRSPDWLATLADGSIYVIDPDNQKVRKIANDAAHTVSTVATLPEGNYFDMIALNGKLYTIAQSNASEGFVLEIDPASGDSREVERGRSDAWQSQGAIYVSGLTSDGAGLITTQAGILLYVPLTGGPELLAGKGGNYIDFDSDYDPSQPHPAGELQLVTTSRISTAGANVFLAYHGGYVYFSAKAETPYVERIACK